MPDVFSKLSPHSYCLKRHIEDLPGYINVKLILENGDIVQHQREMSYPVCQCEELGEFEKIQIESLFSYLESQKKNNLDDTLRSLQGAIEDYRHSRYSDKREFFEEISLLSKNAREGLASNEELRQTWGPVVQDADRIVRSLATEIRFGAY